MRLKQFSTQFWIVSLLVIILFVPLVIVAYQMKLFQPAGSKVKTDFKVLYLASGPIADQSWDAKGFEAYLTIKKKYGVDGDYQQEVKPNQVESIVISHVNQGYTLIIGNGGEYVKPFSKLALEYPKVQFIALGVGDSKIQNLAGPNFHNYPIGYFSGIIAALMTKTDTVGILAAYSPMDEEKGFEDAVKKYNPKVKIIEETVNSWNDKQKAVQLTKEMENENADIVFSLGDAFNFPVIQELHAHGKYAIGYIEDQAFIAPTTVLTSGVLRNDKLILQTVDKWVHGTLKPGKLSMSYMDGVEEMAPLSPKVPSWVKRQFDQAIQDYSDGTLTLPDTVYDK